MSIFTLYHLVFWTTQLLILGVGIVGLKRYKLLNLSSRILLWYIFLCTGVDWIKYIMGYFHIRTHILANIEFTIETGLILGILYCWRINKRFGALVVGAYLLYVIVWITGKFTFEPINNFGVYSIMVSQIEEIVFGCWLLITVLQDDIVILKNNPQFWIVSGIVLYAAVTFFFFGLYNEMLKVSIDMMRKVYFLNYFFIIISHLFFLRAFLCKPLPASSAGNGGTTEAVESL
jgi:hypothetical protein